MISIQNSDSKKAPRRIAGTSTAPLRPLNPAWAPHASTAAPRLSAPRSQRSRSNYDPHSKFLIANAGLEFSLTPFSYSHLELSNREYIAAFQSAFSLYTSPAAEPNHSPTVRRNTGFLIETPRLEFRLTSFTYTHFEFSNRDYIAVFHSAFSPGPSRAARSQAPNIVSNCHLLITRDSSLITFSLPAPPCYTAPEPVMSPTP